MFRDSKVFSSFSTDDIARSTEFYGDVLGLEVDTQTKPMNMLTIHLATGGLVLVYPKDDHAPATYTVLNFPVAAIDQVVDELVNKGVTFEHYENMTDEKGITRGISTSSGPDIAWFKDPAGNILSVIQEK